MLPSNLIKLTVGFAVVCFAGIASADIVYTNSDLGEKAEEDVVIELTGLEAHTQLSVNFDLYIYDSWDGHTGSYCDDFFGMNVDGEVKAWSFDNFGGEETNTVVADEVGNFNAINYWGEIDRIFNDYNGGFVYDHTGSEATIVFGGFGAGFQCVDDESWSVKNLVVATNAETSVPEPTLLLLLGTGLLGLAGFSRKKSN